jgi:hypothetical protein
MSDDKPKGFGERARYCWHWCHANKGKAAACAILVTKMLKGEQMSEAAIRKLLEPDNKPHPAVYKVHHT